MDEKIQITQDILAASKCLDAMGYSRKKLYTPYRRLVYFYHNIWDFPESKFGFKSWELRKTCNKLGIPSDF